MVWVGAIARRCRAPERRGTAEATEPDHAIAYALAEIDSRLAGLAPQQTATSGLSA
jgi:hypothetical protein